MSSQFIKFINFIWSPTKCLRHCSTCFVTAKGRTNIEMREQFTLAEGVSQSMAHFKTRVAGGQHGAGSQASSASSASGYSSSSASGTIGKVCLSLLMAVKEVLSVPLN